MVEALGKNADDLRKDLINYYPKHEFVNYNYGFGATNILSLPARLYNLNSYHGDDYPAIINQGYDLIIIESFAYNPLSDMALSDGLKKQSEILDATFKELIKTHPDSVVSVMATIAPNKKYFGKGMLDLSSEGREKWASERMAYLENAVKFSKERNIPLINVYEKSLTAEGEGDLRYINPTDYVHPSTDGVQLICKTIADFIYENKIFPE